jgi:hypothetical protein
VFALAPLFLPFSIPPEKARSILAAYDATDEENLQRIILAAAWVKYDVAEAA